MNVRTQSGRDWETFVLANGWRAQAYELAAVIGRSVADVERVRCTRACCRLKKCKRYAELFSLWHGRPPADHEWPLPRRAGRGQYEWQGPEIALLACLVGTLSLSDIAKTLTLRLVKITGDKAAARSGSSVQVRINKIGLQSTDVMGGITTREAAREIGSTAVINQAVHKKELRATRVGRLWVIPHEEWQVWKSKRQLVPQGYVRLSSIRESLAIKSDAKLPEFASMGYIPTAIRCKTYGTMGPSTQYGTWYIDKRIATQLVADRRAGRAMPWHGKPTKDNLRATYALWLKRMHPASCETCGEVWGKLGAPSSFEIYAARYPELAFGAKRHLTRLWTPGLTPAEVAVWVGRSLHEVRRAIVNGMLEATKKDGHQYVSRTDATRWKARKCPTGVGQKSWLTISSAMEQYQFTQSELRKFVAQGMLKSKLGTGGPMRGVLYVSKHQCALLREKQGFTEKQAAQRAGVTVPQLRALLKGVNWRGAEGIPLATIQAVVKRRKSQQGYSIEEAAAKIGRSIAWVRARIDEGAVKVAMVHWDDSRVYLTMPMFRRLLKALKSPAKPVRLSDDWLLLSQAAIEAGVTATTIIHWSARGELARRESSVGWRYHREAVRERARAYWQKVRFHRATLPDWLTGNRGAAHAGENIDDKGVGRGSL